MLRPQLHRVHAKKRFFKQFWFLEVSVEIINLCDEIIWTKMVSYQFNQLNCKWFHVITCKVIECVIFYVYLHFFHMETEKYWFSKTYQNLILFSTPDSIESVVWMERCISAKFYVSPEIVLPPGIFCSRKTIEKYLKLIMLQTRQNRNKNYWTSNFKLSLNPIHNLFFLGQLMKCNIIFEHYSNHAEYYTWNCKTFFCGWNI